jgi:transketolase C-terminal domain/subunit
MSRIEVDIAGLSAAGGQAATVGADVAALAGEAAGLAAAGDAPPATGAALAALAGAWSSGLATLGEEIRAVGVSADAAAALYQRADTGSMGG